MEPYFRALTEDDREFLLQKVSLQNHPKDDELLSHLRGNE